MKIALLGGAFNPLHIGHAMIAETVIKELQYDKVIFVPTFISPHKENVNIISATERLEMIKLFCSDEKSFTVDDNEIKREGLSYTYDTVKYIINKYKNSLSEKIGLIIGQENSVEFHKWHKAEELANMTNIIIARRENYNTDVNIDDFKNKTKGNYTGGFDIDNKSFVFPFEHTMLNNPLILLSSTEIRARIALGKSWRYLVPKQIFQYIIEKQLYGYRKK